MKHVNFLFILYILILCMLIATYVLLYMGLAANCLYYKVQVQVAVGQFTPMFFVSTFMLHYFIYFTITICNC